MTIDSTAFIHPEAFVCGDVRLGARASVWPGAVLRGDSAPEILRFANAAAALRCTRPGAIRGVPTLAEVNASLGAPGT